MNRLEIIYTVNANMIKVLSQADKALIPDSCKHYLEEKDKSKQLYRQKKRTSGQQIGTASRRIA
mgnify:CR=1 FL=1